MNQELIEALNALTKATNSVAKLIRDDKKIEEFVPTSKAVEILQLGSSKPLLSRVKNGTFKHGFHYKKVAHRNLQFNVRKCEEFFTTAPEKREWR